VLSFFKIPWDFPGKKGHSLGIFLGNLAHVKGVLIMTTVPFTVVCSMLSVDAKTLRQWLKHSNLSFHAHPTDARVKCLTFEQVQQLAVLHGRSIKQDAAPPLEPEPAAVPLVQPEEPTHLQSGSQWPSTLRADADVISSLSASSSHRGQLAAAGSPTCSRVGS
jgi:hypothetical protein